MYKVVHIFFPLLGNICPKKPLSETCIQLLTSPFPPGGKKGFMSFISHKPSLSEAYREGAGLFFTADLGFMLEKLPHKALNTSKNTLD